MDNLEKNLLILEKLAFQTHYNDTIQTKINNLSEIVRACYLRNDSLQIRNKLSNKKYFPDKTGVVSDEVSIYMHGDSYK